MSIIEEIDGRLHADVLDHGHVVLEKWMGGDLDITNSARISFDQESDEVGESEEGLIGFLMRNKHGTPFEAPTLRFDIKAPIFLFREFHRHRVGWSYNEMSGRYTELPREFYVPARDDIRHQVGKPGSYSFERMDSDADAEGIRHAIWASSDSAFTRYQQMLNSGVAKEVARLVLPVNTYSRMKAGCNLRSLMHFLALRNHEHAQREIRMVAEQMEAMALQKFPVAMAAFISNGRIAP